MSEETIRKATIPKQNAAEEPTLGPGDPPDYFGFTPNYANTALPTVVGGVVQPGTGVRKFVDSLPGVGPNHANDLNHYIPVAVPDTITYPGSDYYEICVQDYGKMFNRDLAPPPACADIGRSTTAPTPAGTTPSRRRSAPTTAGRSSTPAGTGRCGSSSSTCCPPARPASCSCPSTPPSPAPAPAR